MKATRPTVQEVTPEVIKAWKEQYTNVFAYKTTDGHKAWFRGPEIAEIEASTALASAGKPVQSNKLLAKSCFLGGDEVVYTEQKYLLGLSNKLQALIVRVEGELEEL